MFEEILEKNQVSPKNKNIKSEREISAKNICNVMKIFTCVMRLATGPVFGDRLI